VSERRFSDGFSDVELLTIRDALGAFSAILRHPSVTGQAESKSNLLAMADSAEELRQEIKAELSTRHEEWHAEWQRRRAAA
jgi:hypothetical protein